MNPRGGDPAGGRAPRLLPPAGVEADRRDRRRAGGEHRARVRDPVGALPAPTATPTATPVVDGRERHRPRRATRAASRATGSSSVDGAARRLRGDLRKQIATHRCAGKPTQRLHGRDARRAACRARRQGASPSRVTPGLRRQAQDARCSASRFGVDGTRASSARSTRPAARVDEMWYVHAQHRRARSRSIFKAEKRKQISGVVGSYEVTRQTIELDAAAGAVPARDHLAVARRHQPVPVPAARRRAHLLGAGREGARPRDPVRGHGAGRVRRLRARDRAVRDRLHERHRATHRRRLRRQVGSAPWSAMRTGRRRAAARARSPRPSASPPRTTRTASRSARKDDEVSLTWGELRERVDALAGGLAGLGVDARRHRRADARQPARVPPRRPGGDDARRDAVLDLPDARRPSRSPTWSATRARRWRSSSEAASRDSCARACRTSST